MTGMVADTCQLLDQRGDSRQCPQVGFVAVSRRSGQKRLGDVLGLFGGEFGFAAGRSLAGQGGVAPALPGGLPAIGHLSRHLQTPRHFWRRRLLLEQLAGSLAPLLHLGMISSLRHAKSIETAFANVTLLCESQ